MLNILFLIISSLLMLIGLAGVIIPVIPGVPLVWLGLFIYAIGTGFTSISITAVVIFFILMVITLALDFVVPMLGIKKYKASHWALLGSFLGFIIGITVFGFWGIILGPIVGAFVAELIAKGELKRGAQAALGALLGSVVGTLLKLTISMVMIGYFIWTFFR
jgi:uncharacterized protein YqgC (DUF456 family)